MKLLEEIEAVESALADLRDLVRRDSPREVTVQMAAVVDQDPDKMRMNLGEWVQSPWPGMRMMLTLVDDDETGARFVLCEVARR